MRQVVLIPDEDGGYIAEVPSLPGCYSQGETVEETLANIKEAIDLHIESMIAHGEDVPDDVPAPVLIESV
jgi:predicted RNase H-like HicB family nuclease